MIYDKDNPIEWRELPFEEVIKLLDELINNQLWRNYDQTKRPLKTYYFKTITPPLHGMSTIPGYTMEDLRQEFLISIWRKLPRVPSDIKHYDYRFSRYIQSILMRTVIELFRLQRVRNRSIKINVYKDGLNYSIPLDDNISDRL